jgi:hypothetical protein
MVAFCGVYPEHVTSVQKLCGLMNLPGETKLSPYIRLLMLTLVGDELDEGNNVTKYGNSSDDHQNFTQGRFCCLRASDQMVIQNRTF